MSTVPNTINEMFLQSHEGILKLFPVWPQEKAASFHQLRTYGAFLVSSKFEEGKVEFVKIISEKGKKCVLKNPWEASVELIRDKAKKEIVTGDILSFPTSIGESIELKAIEN